MAKFTDYTEKTEPVDTDLALIYDTPAKVNKKFTFGNLWKWIAKKIVSEGISQLDTTNKTIPGAINELNSKTPSKYVNSLENYMKNAPIGVNFCDCQGADDNPDKGTMSICMTFVNDDHSWGVQYLFVYERIRYRIMSNVAVDEWRRII